MSRTRSRVIAATLTLAAGAAAIAYVARRAEADGVPQTDPLSYSGTLLDPNTGAPIAGPVDLVISLWTAPTGGTQQCTTSAPGTPLTAGRFQVVLSAACATAVKATPDLYVDVRVGTESLLPRPRVGAAPYALEADTARRTVRTVGGERYSSGGGFCGATAVAQDGDMGGYAGAKALCEAVASCSSSAHMCTTDEIIRHKALGQTHPQGWFASGVWVPSGGIQVKDCDAWTDNGSGRAGMAFAASSSTEPGPFSAVCNTTYPVLCCD